MSTTDDREVSVRYTVTTERVLTGDLTTIARTLGMSVNAMTAIIDNGADYPDLSETTQGRLLRSRNAEVESEDFTLDSIEEA